MNIRTLTNPITAVESQPAHESKAVRTSVSSEDRDADGRRQDTEQDKSPLNEEEMISAKEYLEKLEGLKTNGLKIDIETSGDIRIFLIRDTEGTVVRRIPEWEMRPLIGSAAKKTGHIFDKSA